MTIAVLTRSGKATRTQQHMSHQHTQQESQSAQACQVAGIMLTLKQEPLKKENSN